MAFHNTACNWIWSIAGPGLERCWESRFLAAVDGGGVLTPHAVPRGAPALPPAGPDDWGPTRALTRASRP
jgi:hypothetical protein